MDQHRRVVVTGMGAVTPLGVGRAELWERAAGGHCAIRRLHQLPAGEYRTPNGGEVNETALGEALRGRRLASGDRTVDLALLAAHEALDQAGLLPEAGTGQPRPIATIFGTGAGATRSLFATYDGFARKGARGIRPTAVPRGMANAVSARLAARYALGGPNFMIVCACSASTAATGQAMRMIRHGYADTVLCGGADTLFDPVSYSAWDNMGVLSRIPDPSRACRPFDAGREGFVMGEGAGALVLEARDAALERGTPILGEICGYGESSDAGHITRPSPEGQTRAITAALRDARLSPGDVGAINAHGTATPVGDASESRAIRSALGPAAQHIPVVSSKSLMGHLVGASGAVETILTLQGLAHGMVHPNLNLDNPDPACDLLFVGQEAMPVSAPVAMKSSFGFGGNNAVLLVRRCED